MKEVSQAKAAQHAEEAKRKQSILAMGGDPTVATATLMVPPITGNDIFRRASASSRVDNEDALSPDISMGSPPPVSLPPHLVSPHFIEDDDFPPDTVEYPHEPPQAPDPHDYPSMEVSDADEDDSEPESDSGTEDQGGVQSEPNLDEFMDWEYLKQGKFSLCTSNWS